MADDQHSKRLPRAATKKPARLAVAAGGTKPQDVVRIVRQAMIEKKLTQAALADAADCHEKTVQNLLAGRPVRAQTLFDIAMVLGLDYDGLQAALAPGDTHLPAALPSTEGTPKALKPAPSPDDAGRGGVSAPVYMGAYTREGTDHLIGSYLTLRPAFTAPETIVAYRTDILWDPTWPSLLFEERERPDASYAHRGRLYIPASSPFLHLVSLTKGAMRMILLSQIDKEDTLRGLITTLNKHRAQLVPVATPILYRKQATFDGDAFGEIGRGHKAYARYAGLLKSTLDEGYARLVTGPP